MNFHVGQKVVCVDVSPFKGATPYVVELNKVYTVKRAGRSWHPFCGDFDAVWVDADSAGNFAWRFRPLVERKTSIELLTSIRPDTPIVGPEIERERFKQKELS